MIRQDGAFELGTPQGGSRHATSLWIILSAVMIVLFAANLWVYALYPSDRVFQSLVLGGPFAFGTDIWRPVTAFLFEPSVPGLLASLLAFYLIVRELEAARGTRWVLGVSLLSTLSSALGTLVIDNWLLARSDVVAFGACGPLLVLCFAYARETGERNVYPFLFLTLKGRNLGLAMAAILLLAFDFRTYPFWSSGHGTVVSAAAPLAAVVGGLACLWFEPILASRVELSRAMREVRAVQREAARQERADRLLEKVAASGLESLTRRELRFLERYSRLAKGPERSRTPTHATPRKYRPEDDAPGGLEDDPSGGLLDA